MCAEALLSGVRWRPALGALRPEGGAYPTQQYQDGQGSFSRFLSPTDSWVSSTIQQRVHFVFVALLALCFVLKLFIYLSSL